MPNVFMLKQFTPDNPNDIRECAKGHWDNVYGVSNVNIASKWVALDKRNRKWYIVDTDYDDKAVLAEIEPIKEEL